VSAVHGSIAFPEVVVPIVACLRRALKTARTGPKVNATVKTLVEQIEESARWISQRRAGVTFAPGKTAAVGEWEADQIHLMRSELSPSGSRYSSLAGLPL